ncbi:hypothetical protein Ancab_004179 [Ancistrocladus abbreviatus]
MVERWNPYEIQLSCFMVLAVLSEIRECDSINLEGLALMEFRERIEDDPYGAFSSWNLNHTEPCLWLGVQCRDGKVQMLDLSGFALRGTLSSGLRKLRYMRSLVLSNNRLSGSIPKEIGELKLLELLDLRCNNLTGVVPGEIGGMPSLRCLLLLGNNFHGGIPPEIEKQCCLCERHCDQSLKSDVSVTNDCVYRKSGHWFIKGFFYAVGEGCCHSLPGSVEDIVGRRLLGEASNLHAPPAHGSKPPEQDAQVVFRTGAFPALTPPASQSPEASHQKLQANANDGGYYVFFPSLLMIILLYLLCLVFPRYKSAKIRHDKEAALVHRLSKVFVTGVPKLDSSELEIACEDFSNIIDTYPGCLMYKGILSTGVEIAVLSTSIRSSKQWSAHAEKEFKKKIDTLSRINHKNFVNLLGYCEEDDPFVRMMVFEYAPNGNLYEHLHVKDLEHLDWFNRVRIIMGMSYCLEYMHHELDPPVVLTSLLSDTILLSDDYAAKISDMSFWAEIASDKEISDGQESGCPHSNRGSSLEENVYSFGILLLEIIMARSPSRKEGSLLDWASQYLSDKEQHSSLVDPTLKSIENNELEIICEVIKQCIVDDPRQRPTMKQITTKLREVINISVEGAHSRFSPLWWAELEILSMENT